MHRKRGFKKTSKYEAEKVHISTTVIKIEEQNVLVNDKYKTVFYCESQNNSLNGCEQGSSPSSHPGPRPEGRMCIAWGKTRIIVGSNVELDGRFKDDVFLVWQMTITNGKALEFEPNPYIEKIKSKLKELRQK